MNHVEFMREIVTMTLIVRVNNLSVLTTKPLKDVDQGYSNLVKDLIKAQKGAKLLHIITLMGGIMTVEDM